MQLLVVLNHFLLQEVVTQLKRSAWFGIHHTAGGRGAAVVEQLTSGAPVCCARCVRGRQVETKRLLSNGGAWLVIHFTSAERGGV